MLEDPLPGYEFLITLDAGLAYLPPSQAALVPLLAAGAFQQVSGLGAELEVLPILRTCPAWQAWKSRRCGEERKQGRRSISTMG